MQATNSSSLPQIAFCGQWARAEEWRETPVGGKENWRGWLHAAIQAAVWDQHLV